MRVTVLTCLLLPPSVARCAEVLHVLHVLQRCCTFFMFDTFCTFCSVLLSLTVPGVGDTLFMKLLAIACRTSAQSCCSLRACRESTSETLSATFSGLGPRAKGLRTSICCNISRAVSLSVISPCETLLGGNGSPLENMPLCATIVGVFKPAFSRSSLSSVTKRCSHRAAGGLSASMCH